MNYWLMKTEPGTYSWDNLVKDKKTHWDGVRNYQARNNMKEMKVGDLVLCYHSVNDKCVVGIAKIVKEYYQDPTTDDKNWVVVEISPVEPLKNVVTLAQIKADDQLSQMVLVKNSRLSVQPVRKEEFDRVVAMGQ
jgi:predicted RNA-binding protein with PUA-like domain